MMALVHDLAEADVGDITPPEHSGVSKQDKLDQEAKAMDRIAGLLGHPSLSSMRVMSLWQEYEARETQESKFVKDLDLFELAVQAVEYENCERPCHTGLQSCTHSAGTQADESTTTMTPQRTTSGCRSSFSRPCPGSSTRPCATGPASSWTSAQRPGPRAGGSTCLSWSPAMWWSPR